VPEHVVQGSVLEQHNQHVIDRVRPVGSGHQRLPSSAEHIVGADGHEVCWPDHTIVNASASRAFVRQEA
jgi:hypothetical protein